MTSLQQTNLTKTQPTSDKQTARGHESCLIGQTLIKWVDYDRHSGLLLDNQI